MVNRAPSGFVLVALAAGLWGSDALFRRGLAVELPASSVVMYEHTLLTIILAPRLRGILTWGRQLSLRDWGVVALIGVGASAVATALFTAAFAAGDPTTPLLLQKLQPLIAVAAATLLLGERLRPVYGAYFLAGITGAYLIAFPDPLSVNVAAITPAVLAIGAASLWGLGTVLGRYLTGADLLTSTQVTALRFAVGLPASIVIVLLLEGPSGLAVATADDLLPLVLLALVPGLAAMLLYYRGLAETSASAATIAELSFPLVAVTIGFAVFGASLVVSQWFGLVLLAGTITVMSLRAQRRDATALGVEADPPSAAVLGGRGALSRGG